jgi:hypothetical protein
MSKEKVSRLSGKSLKAGDVLTPTDVVMLGKDSHTNLTFGLDASYEGS